MIAVLDRLPYHVVERLLGLAIVLHNAEEGLTASRYLPRVGVLLEQYSPFGVRLVPPSLGQLHLALVVVTVLPLLLLTWATTGRSASHKDYVAALLAAALFWNIWVPHVPAAIAFGGYAPGVVTAVGINLPLTVYFLRRSLRDGRLSAGRLAAAVTWGLVLLGLAPLLLARSVTST